MSKRLRVILSLLLLAAPVPSLSRSSADPALTPLLIDAQSFLVEQLTVPRPARPDDARRVQDLLARMTLKEKVGQMTQLTIAMVSDGKDAALRVNREKLQKAVVEYGVGSILNVNDLAMPVSWWNDTLRQIQATAAETRLKIPVLYGIDSIHGANYVTGATLFPQPLGMAATWNPQLMLEASRITAAETRAAGIPWNFSPVLDIGRQPLWSRLYETFGEDVELAKVMGVATVRGYQGSDPSAPVQVAACLKHYVGYSFPTSGHDRTPALIPEVTLREYFLPTFAAAVKAGALSVMVNSGEVNGVPGHVNGFLLKDVLRGEMGFDGVVVSDWEDIKKLVAPHRAAADEKEATRRAVLAGIDMSMVPNDYSFSDLLVKLVDEGAVPTSRIDEAVGRILMMKLRLGLFDDPVRGIDSPARDRRAFSPEARQVARQAAAESITLLKNEGGVLPLSPGKKVLVTGPTADSLVALNNGWTIVWQGDRADAYPKDRLTIHGALQARLGADKVTYVKGASYDREDGIAAAAAAAQKADAVVLCLGEMSYAETPGDIEDLNLPEAQLRLAHAVAASGKPVVLVLVEGRPRIIRPIADTMKAIVMAYNPGLEGGQALADVLLGDVNPSGRLPITYPRSANALVTYDHKASEDGPTPEARPTGPQFAFGSGLSYTTFAYSDLSVTPARVGPQDGMTVSVSVRNTGPRTGAEVVQLYVSQHAASLSPPVKRLKRFAKLTLAPGATQDVRFRLTRDDLAFIGPANKPVVEGGGYSLLVGSLKQDIKLD